MGRNPVVVHICEDENCSWNTLWKWSWFTRQVWMPDYWEKTKLALQPLFPLLSELKVKSILDCSCGLGFKTIMFAKMGYEVEGSDASAIAIKYAPQLAKEQGLKIKFFISSFEDLARTSKHMYDCVYSDYFDELETHKALQASAKGICSVLKKDGKFIFCSFSPEWKKSELNKLVERVWKERERFKIDPPVEQNGVKVIHIEVADKTSEGILENNIYLIEERGVMRAEIAPIMNPRIKWTYSDYVKILSEAGFKKIEHIKREKNEIFIIAIK